MNINIVGYDGIPKDDLPVTKIIYYYDHNLRLYTFLMQDQENNNITTDYCTKGQLIQVKTRLTDEYGIKPIKESN